MSNWQWTSIGSDNGLVPNSRQAIIWTNADPKYSLLMRGIKKENPQIFFNE